MANKKLVDLISTNEYKVNLENKETLLENMKVLAEKYIKEEYHPMRKSTPRNIFNQEIYYNQ